MDSERTPPTLAIQSCNWPRRPAPRRNIAGITAPASQPWSHAWTCARAVLRYIATATHASPAVMESSETVGMLNGCGPTAGKTLRQNKHGPERKMPTTRGQLENTPHPTSDDGRHASSLVAGNRPAPRKHTPATHACHARRQNRRLNDYLFGASPIHVDVVPTKGELTSKVGLPRRAVSSLPNLLLTNLRSGHVHRPRSKSYREHPPDTSTHTQR